MKKLFQTLTLTRLTLRNFKGIFDQTFDLSGSTDIYGANESGKSTFLSAFLWLLTGKDEFDRKDYEIKNTKDLRLNSQAHEVEGVFEKDGKEVILKRVYLENWVKPRGDSQKVMEGHVTEYYIDNVKCRTAKEYTERVNELMPVDLIKVLTNPAYFNNLHWEEQRRTLITMAGPISDTSVIDQIATPKDDFGTLIMVLNSGKNIERHKKELAQKLIDLKNTIANYPVQIQEAKVHRPEDQDWEQIEASIKEKEASIASVDELIDNALKALDGKHSAISKKKNELFKKQNALQEIRDGIEKRLLAEHDDVPNQIKETKEKARSRSEEILQLEKEIKAYQDRITAAEQSIEAEKEKIRVHAQAWNAINAEKFEFDESKCQCPTCKRPLEQEDIAKQREQLLTNFSADVAQRKEDQVKKANDRKAEKARLEASIVTFREVIEKAQLTLDSKMVLRDQLNEKIDKLIESQKTVAHDPIEVEVNALLKNNADALNLRDEITALQSEVETLTQALNDEADHTEDKKRRDDLRKELQELKSSLKVREIIEKVDKRIEQLEKEERETAQAIANLEQQQFDVDKFTRAKMDMVQERVNDLFHPDVRYRLFDKQVNGQIVETCVCEYKGVPYPTANTAGKLFAGLEVLNTLSQYYGICAPVICDNRESVTRIPEIKSQVISLFVSPKDKKLRIEPAQEMAHAS